MRRLSLAPAGLYTGLVEREDGRLVVQCAVQRRRVSIEDCARCKRLVGLRAGGLSQRRGVYLDCRPAAADAAAATSAGRLRKTNL